MLHLELEPVTVGTSGLGKRPGADLALATAILSSTFHQADTSNNYADGESERLLGEAIRGIGGLPEERVVFSKGDQDPVTGAFTGDRMRRSFEESTERLGLETLPLYHLHDPYTISVTDAMAPGGAVDALIRLREQGRIGAIGIAAGRRELVEEYVRTDVFDAVLTHNRYTVVDRSAERILDLATERGMTVFNAAPFGAGILAGDNFRGRTYGYSEPSAEFLAHVDRFRALCAEWGVEPATAALHFSLRDPRIHSTVVGVNSTERLAELERHVQASVDVEFWAALDALGTPPAPPTD
ncbi:aldo/keto reductase [Protaetiibacter mangrovi]|uniref:Aldo/keto reductase n=1 Tax=Protaetiibacter mangrovi TaxID=2970926 RepID=A0ABT1ZGZ9_9MICO|nr:aldo/keto reductase [Protaetiibacter mangrovi]MCS0499993.1 aldo/keto reductase [Protaetiibacter mangrovi]TPX02080.1 aldo/keto reductase [Schumannella luteola]